MVYIIRPYYNNSYRANLLLKKTEKYIYLVLFLGSELFIVLFFYHREQKSENSSVPASVWASCYGHGQVFVVVYRIAEKNLILELFIFWWEYNP